MSEGPIKAWRDSWRPPVVSTPNRLRVCFDQDGRGYCGRTSAKTRTSDWAEVVCADCRAAAIADGVLDGGAPSGTGRLS